MTNVAFGKSEGVPTWSQCTWLKTTTSMSSGFTPPFLKLSAVSGDVDVGWRWEMWCCCAAVYPEKSRLSPRSKTKFVVLLIDGDLCLMRKQREGTVVRFSGSALVMKRLSGSVRLPPSSAEIVTKFWPTAGGGSESFWAIFLGNPCQETEFDMRYLVGVEI
jgi:hypothetical protein